MRPSDAEIALELIYAANMLEQFGENVDEGELHRRIESLRAAALSLSMDAEMAYDERAQMVRRAIVDEGNRPPTHPYEPTSLRQAKAALLALGIKPA